MGGPAVGGGTGGHWAAEELREPKPLTSLKNKTKPTEIKQQSKLSNSRCCQNVRFCSCIAFPVLLWICYLEQILFPSYAAFPCIHIQAPLFSFVFTVAVEYTDRASLSVMWPGTLNSNCYHPQFLNQESLTEAWPEPGAPGLSSYNCMCLPVCCNKTCLPFPCASAELSVESIPAVLLCHVYAW